MQLAPVQHETLLAVALEGKPLKEIAAAVGLTVRTLFRIAESDITFRNALAQARDSGIDVLVDEMLTIARDENIPVDRARVLCDVIRWIAARRAQRRYGDRLDMNINQSIDLAGTLIEARRRSEQPVCNQLDPAQSQVIDATYEYVRGDTDKESAPEPDIFS